MLKVGRIPPLWRVTDYLHTGIPELRSGHASVEAERAGALHEHAYLFHAFNSKPLNFTFVCVFWGCRINWEWSRTFCDVVRLFFGACRTLWGVFRHLWPRCRKMPHNVGQASKNRRTTSQNVRNRSQLIRRPQKTQNNVKKWFPSRTKLIRNHHLDYFLPFSNEFDLFFQKFETGHIKSIPFFIKNDGIYFCSPRSLFFDQNV